MGKNKLTNAYSHITGQGNTPLSLPAHALHHEVVVAELFADPDHGLSSEDASARLQEHGRNELGGGHGVQPVKILVRQFANAMMLVALPHHRALM